MALSNTAEWGIRWLLLLRTVSITEVQVCNTNVHGFDVEISWK
jgi:hypothetical protein